MIEEHWYKNAVFYAVDVDRFQDSNGDGIGDFQGLISRLDYIEDLGATCIWLLPFYPAPDRDNGYDITNYYGVDKSVGTLQDFIEFVHKAGERGIRVLVDIVMNHTSDQHPWFEAARRDKQSRYYNYYVWNDSPVSSGRETIFPGEEPGVWTFDEIAGQYYHHLFYHFQPDLNVRCEAVQEEIHKVVDFWLSFGIAGLRIDAAPHMIDRKGLKETMPRDPHGVLKGIRGLVSGRRPDAILIGESNVPPDDLVNYFGDNDEFHMLFNFLLNNFLFLALARERSEPLERVLRLLPSIRESGQWANFIRNLDEADFKQVTPEERQEIFDVFAPEFKMQIYGRGIRRRIAPMLGNELQRRMVFSLLISLPGTPVLIYGDEYGLGDNLKENGRDAVRAPMAWNGEENGGFSTARPEKLIQRPVMRGPYSYKKINVEKQLSQKDSFLRAVREMIHVRKECPEIGWGTWHILETKSPSVFVHLCEWKGQAVIAFHNLGAKPVKFMIDLAHHNVAGLEQLLGNGQCEPYRGRFRTQLDGFGYAWFRVEKTPRNEYAYK